MPRRSRIALAGLLTGAFVAAMVVVVVWLLALPFGALGPFLACALVVLLLLSATGRTAWLWSLLSIDDPLSWAGFIPPLWRWALRDDRPASVRWH